MRLGRVGELGVTVDLFDGLALGPKSVLTHGNPHDARCYRTAAHRRAKRKEQQIGTSGGDRA